MFRIETDEDEVMLQGETLLDYYPGQPIIGVFKMEASPLPLEWDYSQGNIWIQAKMSMSQQLAHKEQEGQKEDKKSLDEILPKHYKQYRTVFEKSASELFPSSRPWDHAIDLKPDFILKDCKFYPLSLAEQAKLDEFIDKNLRKGYI